MDISEQLKILPESSGSYQFFDKSDEIIYVGKANNLKKRVSSYFVKNHTSQKLRVMVPKISKIQFIITNSEVEALILESHLIKKYKPKYNVLLKDDKKFPYFVITEEEYPRILVTRKQNKNRIKGKYFGPYTNGRAMYATLDLLKKLFPLKQCKTPKFKDRPCIYYNIGRCMAPCQKLISPEEYKKLLKNVELFLSGKQGELVEHLKQQMQMYSEKQEFEKAARFRDSYFDVQKTMENQKVITENTNVNQDIIALSRDKTLCAISLIQIRAGRLTDKKDFELQISEVEEDISIITAFFKEYYELSAEFDIPQEIVFFEQISAEDKSLYESWLTSKAGKNVLLNNKNTKRNLEIIEIAKKNSNYYLEKLKVNAMMALQNDYNEVGAYIQEKLNLSKFPHIVECFDISHIQGTNTVASMVTFENGFPKKSSYKRFRVKSQDGKPDDFESMREVVRRRYKALQQKNEQMPDLIIIDGGKGQLSAAKLILDELGIKNQNIVSLAKRIEEVFVPNKSRPLIFPSSASALYFFQKIRDEAHRFAVSYHRNLREKSALYSTLDEIKGLFEKNKKLLIEKYGSVSKISKLTEAELALLIKPSQAKKVFEYYNKTSLDT